jgi:hypothetical protein
MECYQKAIEIERMARRLEAENDRIFFVPATQKAAVTNFSWRN